MFLLLLLLGSAGALCLAKFIYAQAWNLGYKRLPPGDMGWPLIGELFSYVPAARSVTPFRFTKEREAKYGPIFKTSLLTGKTIMVTDMEGVKFVLQNEGILFESGYPASLKNVLGSYSMLFQHGDFHKRMHAMVRRFVSSTPLKKHLTKEMENLTKQAMSSWPRGQRLLLQDEVQRVTHDFLMKQLFGIGPGEVSNNILAEFNTLMGGIIGLPYMIPGTPYYRAMKAKQKLHHIIRNMVQDRRAHPEIEHNDILQALIEEVREDEPEEIILDNIIINIANGEGVPSAVITFAIKNLSECPEALKKVREENLAIRKNYPNEGLSWNDYMSLNFTQCVFNETLRLANGAQGVMRRALKDVEYRGAKMHISFLIVKHVTSSGYIIPKGWTVLPYFLNLHFDENTYPDPTKFNPWRWQEKNIPPTYFVPFGGGPRLCPGQELARVQSVVFLHHLVTQFKWDAEPEMVINFPKIRTKNNLPVVLYDL